ncbi:MAG: hypothetical protein ABIZ05_05345 [Pseudonocardiaceae bacterium]
MADRVRHTLFGPQHTLYIREQDDFCVLTMFRAAAWHLRHDGPGRSARTHQPKHIRPKGDRDMATDVDLTVERMIREFLAAPALPDPILAAVQVATSSPTTPTTRTPVTYSPCYVAGRTAETRTS